MKKLKAKREPRMITDMLNLVTSTADDFGDKDVYIYIEDKQEKHFTFNDNRESVLNFGEAICKLGLQGTNIAVIGDTHPYYLTTFYAVISSNSTIVPLDRDLGDDALIDFMNIAGVTALVYTSKFNNRMRKYADRIPTLRYFFPINDSTEDCSAENVIPFPEALRMGKEAREAGSTEFTDIVPDLSHTAAIMFTSGTTGTSKGVMLSHGNFVAATNSSTHSMQYDDDNFFVDCLPMNHSYEITCGQLGMLAIGATKMINDSMKNTLRNFAKYKPNALCLVPLYVETMYKRIWSEIDKKGMRKTVRRMMKISDGLLKIGIDMRDKFFGQITGALGGNLRSIVVGGAPMNPKIIKDFYSFGIFIIEGYGITECSPLVSVNRPGEERYGSVGKPVMWCEVRIDKASPEDETGEIQVRGDNVMQGYYKNPEATAEVFTDDGWFRTGDIGYIDKDGYIFITGRKKNVIILSNGKNIFPEELEEHLADRSDVIGESVVIGRQNESTGETAITAIIYPNPDFSKDKSPEEVEKAVRDAVDEVNKSLPQYKHMTSVELRDTEFEKTTTRKIKRYLVK
ncbi:MAG: AMP-binding protein [Clostridia bacterium]|nr:AMP-binding protein [Clostridia bacterium]